MQDEGDSQHLVSHAIREAKAGEPVIGWFGGHPRGVGEEDWPSCRVCGAAMCHMGQINAGPHLDLAGYDRVSLFICHATGGRCKDWDPNLGANMALLQRNCSDQLFDGPPTVRVYHRVKLTIEKGVDEAAIIESAGPGSVGERVIKTHLDHEKIGGLPIWHKKELTPMSTDGSEPMRMLMQFSTGIVQFDITESGVGYLFIDDSPGAVAVKLLWVSGNTASAS